MARTLPRLRTTKKAKAEPSRSRSDPTAGAIKCLSPCVCWRC